MKFRSTLLLAVTLFAIAVRAQKTSGINRQQLVERHTVRLNKADTLASLSVGNGSFPSQ